MIITDLDLQIEDIEWYGVDKNGRIAQFMSGGSFAVPEFVRESRENLEIVSHFFEKYNQTISETVLFNKNIEYPRKEFWEECKYISQKEIYCYDIRHKSEFMNEYIYVSTIINILMLWAVRIPSAYLITRYFDGTYIMLCFPISFSFGMIMMIGYYLFSKKWKEIIRTGL